MDTKNFSKNKLFLCIGIIFVVFFMWHGTAFAALLQLSSSKQTMVTGETKTMSIFLNTEGVPVNNAEASLSFPSDLVDVISINKTGSVFSLWIEEPSFSNSTGLITFNGGVPTPGYNGAHGLIFSFTVKAKKAGTAIFTFPGATVRADDGSGASLPLRVSLSPTVITQKPVAAPTSTTAAPITSSSLSAPVIVSVTNPDQSVWYSSKTASFGWEIPNSATLIQTLYSKNPNSTPQITYDSSVSQKTLFNLSDNIFYFHLRYFDSGKWSPAAHYRFMIDSTPPEEFTATVQSLNNQNIIKLNATDATSGIDHYTITIDNNDALSVKKDELINGEYVLPILNEGNHDIVVVAYDKAGNHKEFSLTFMNPFAITVPKLYLSSAEILRGESVTILGKTDYPNTQVEITLESDGKDIKKYTQSTSADGSFSVTTDEFEMIGLVDVWARSILSNKVISQSSDKLNLKVSDKNIINFSVHIYWIYGIGAFIILLLLVLIRVLYHLRHVEKVLKLRE